MRLQEPHYNANPPIGRGVGDHRRMTAGSGWGPERMPRLALIPGFSHASNLKTDVGKKLVPGAWTFNQRVTRTFPRICPFARALQSRIEPLQAPPDFGNLAHLVLSQWQRHEEFPLFYYGE